MSFPAKDNIDDIFPEDPTQPSLSLASSNGSPITLPWAKSESGQLIATLGTGCHPAKLQSDSAVAPFMTQHALSASTLQESIRFRSEVGAKSSFHKAITSTQATHSEHMSGSAKFSAGCKFANASGSGTYNKSVLENEDDMKASVQATIRTGVIYFDSPRLSLDAIADTRRSTRNRDYFSRKYGGYYVASLHLGADAGVLASVSSKDHTESESMEIKAKLHVLWWDVAKSHREEKHSEEAFSTSNITAFETLAGSNVKNGDSNTALTYIQRVSNLKERVRDKMDELKLQEDKMLKLEDVKEICEAGLVAEITLLPYSQMRDYTAALIERD